MGMAFVKWVPWNYGERIPINKRHVVTVCNTHPVVLEYYNKTTDKIKNYKPRTKVEAAANAITGMEDPEEPDGAREQLERIIEYYKLSKRKKKKMQIVKDIILFEKNILNCEIVERRKILWYYIEEIKSDNYLSKFLILE